MEAIESLIHLKKIGSVKMAELINYNRASSYRRTQCMPCTIAIYFHNAFEFLPVKNLILCHFDKL